MWIFRALLIGVVAKGCQLIAVPSNGTTSTLIPRYADKSSAALEIIPRQRFEAPNIQRQTFFRPDYAPSQAYRPPYNPYQYIPPPNQFGGGLDTIPQAFSAALESIATHDELHCVPRLLCELTSGSRSLSARQLPSLPFNINMESFLGLLDAVNGADLSPLLLFGKAAALGYSSQGNSSPCMYSYPRCPTDPDKLVHYLNNYNGGFFRFFNGAPPRQQYGPSQYAEKRILTKPFRYVDTPNSIPLEIRWGTEIKFPTTDDRTKGFRFGRVSGLRFPDQERHRLRSPKALSFPTVDTVNLDFQKPPSNHVAAAIIFPTRTGTGELILDSDVFERERQNHVHSFY